MKHSFAEILSKSGIVFVSEGQHHHAHQGWINFDCPFCSPGAGKYRMGYNLSRGNVNCWVCGSHPIIDTLSKLTGMAPSQCSAVLDRGKPSRTPTAEVPGGKYLPPTGLGPLGKRHRRYLLNRGFEPEKLEFLWKIRGLSLSEPGYNWRIFIPVFVGDLPASWITRATVDGGKDKYRSSPKARELLPLRNLLYGEEFCQNVIIVNEGPLDAWAIGPSAVATCGIGYTQSQMMKIARYPTRVICFDNEPDAQKRARKLCDDLSVFPGETYNVTLDAKDASRASKKEIRKLRKLFLGTNWGRQML